MSRVELGAALSQCYRQSNSRWRGACGVLLLLLLATAPGCDRARVEGAMPDDCSDGADNDADGRYDCDDDGCFGSPDCNDNSPYPGLLESGVTCDAGDEAFVRRLIPQLWGRRPRSIREVELLLEVIEQRDRATLTEQMMTSEEFVTRWREVLFDMLEINRVGERTCRCVDYTTRQWMFEPGLAEFVRDTAPSTDEAAPTEPGPGSGEVDWGLTELVHSALALDDLSPIYRMALFTRLASKIINLDNPGANLAWRSTYGDMFERTFLNRRMGCMQCHNSEFSASGSFDPELDRTWEVPALFERAVFGDSAGRPSNDLSAFFRVEGVLSMRFVPEGVTPTLFWTYGEGFSPWGMHDYCGEFILPADIEVDPDGWEGYFIDPVPDRPSVWDLEARLQSGFDKIRVDGMQVAEDGTIDGERAFAWMVSMTIVEKMWVELTSRRITAPHFMPRNRYQRDLLIYFTETFVEAGFSMKEALRAMVLHPYFNAGTQVQCESLESSYYMAPIYDPWVSDYEIPEQRLNSVGDFVTRLPPRALLRSVSQALEWRDIESRLVEHDHGEDDEPVPSSASPALSFELDIGVFLLDGERGFRSNNFSESLAWEETLGGCDEPFLSPEETRYDWIDKLLDQASEDATLEELALTLKDRLLAEPSFDGEEERTLIEALTQAPLDTTLSQLSDAQGSLRRLCAAWLASPDFQLEGAPAIERAGTEPPNNLGGSDRSILCEQLLTSMFRGDTASCDEDGHLVLSGQP